MDAKRYLAAVNPRYLERLSVASTETLRLRSWDEMAKDPRWAGPGLASYRQRIEATCKAAARQAAI